MGEMVATFSSASREVASEKSGWLRMVIMEGGREGPLRLAQQKRGTAPCKLTQPQELCIQTP